MIQDSIKIAFLDVGQGDSTVVVLPDNTTAVVVDSPAKSPTIDYLESSGIVTLSHVFLTHTDGDHVGGIVDLVSNFQQVEGTILAWNLDTYRVREGNRRTTLRKLLGLRERRGLKLAEPRTGTQYALQGLIMDVLHPDTSDLYEAQVDDNPNDASVLLKLRFGKYRALLTGDIQAQGWFWVVKRGPNLKADLLKFPHHGAWYKPDDTQPSLENVMSLVDPRVAIISVGSNSNYDHPDDRTVEMLCSLPGVMFAHTQPTGRCYSIRETRRGPFSCAGTVEAVISEDGVTVAGETSFSFSQR